ncbi:MAG: hypothetical protein EX271_01525 [Acidimicrobiales bacterium]|nr:L,D-transpeptidase family protein [Hyphomonadaceae bacterium]RZV44494.1 MAG: hypothetical protein EX271_01525 [Acidimicrobiales bacterium]
MNRHLLLSAAFCLALAPTPAFATDGPVPHTGFNENIPIQMMGDELDRPIAMVIEDRLTTPKKLKKIENEFGSAGAKVLTRSYAGRLYRPIWTEVGAESLQGVVDNLFDHGIVSDQILRNDLRRTIKSRFTSKSPKSRAKADIQLSLAWLRTAKAIGGGLKDEGGMATPMKIGVKKFNLTDSLLQSGLGKSSTELFAMAPNTHDYQKLIAALATYRELAANGGWRGIPEGDAIEVGDKDPRVPALRTRLRAEGFYDLEQLLRSPDADIAIDVLDENTVIALKKFQRRHGLNEDGILGNNTLKAMNESVESKIDKISDALHRWRYQGDMGQKYIWANIPSYTATGWNRGKKEITMRTIVGKPRFATPEFSDQVEYMVANPKWYLPVSIIRRQKVPKLKRDPGYADKYGYNIYDRKTGEKVDAYSVDWTERGVARKYRFVQEAGEGNALGDMKIIFPNQYSVYLHGTPGEHLFEKAQRAFSSGCVRLEDPVRMAKWIARHDDEVARTDITEAIEETENTRFELDEHVPVHITYFLVTANDDGSVNFHRDIYKRDDGIRTVKKMAKLYKPKPTTVGAHLDGESAH